MRKTYLSRISGLLALWAAAGAAPAALAQVAEVAGGADELVQPPDIPLGWKIIEGDIQVPVSFGEGPEATWDTNFWPGGVVPYEFAGNVNGTNQAAMLAAMAEWEAVANVNFKPRNGESDYVRIQNSTGNNSAVGMVGGQQIINIASWNSKFIIAHELGHCLGYFHEHTRPDRNTFVTIVNANIQSGFGGNFTLNTTADTLGSYDFDSVMHYDKCSFSTNCPSGSTCACASGTETILVKQPFTAQWQNAIGQRTHLSTLDKNVMRCIYPYSNDRFLDKSYTGAIQIGTLFFPWQAFKQAHDNAPSGATILVISAGEYSAKGVYSKPLRVQAQVGTVTLK